MIKQSFEEEVYWYIYGCFDLVGGFDGKFIKLLEFNVDIFIMFYEMVVIQWVLFKVNGYDENK